VKRFTQLAGTLDREAFWSVANSLGTSRLMMKQSDVVVNRLFLFLLSRLPGE
jgi:hypothetical protein